MKDNIYNDYPENLESNDSKFLYYKELDKVQKEYEFSVDTDAGIVYLTGPITEETVYEVIGSIRMIMRMRKKDNDSPITLFINSYGGDVYAMIGIIDYIRSMTVKVDTIIRGTAMSAAAIIAASGTGVRKMSINSTIMIHELTAEFIEGTRSNIKKNSEHIMALQNRINELLAQFTGKDKSVWEKVIEHETFLNSQQALEYGLVDEII